MEQLLQLAFEAGTNQGEFVLFATTASGECPFSLPDEEALPHAVWPFGCFKARQRIGDRWRHLVWFVPQQIKADDSAAALKAIEGFFAE